MHDVLNNISSCNISNLFNSVNVIHTYITRFSSADNLYTKYSRLTHQIKPFSRQGLMIWNSIPPDLRNLSKSCFKNKMQHYLRQILNQEEDYRKRLCISRIHRQAAPPISKRRIWKKVETTQSEVSVKLYCYKQPKTNNQGFETLSFTFFKSKTSEMSFVVPSFSLKFSPSLT